MHLLTLIVTLILIFDSRNMDNECPLHMACINEKSEVVIELLRRYPQKINVLGCNDRHMLHYACEFGDWKLSMYFLTNPNFNIDCNIVDDHGWTPLLCASFSGQYEFVKFLLENAKEKGIDVSKKNIDQRTAEDFAKQEGHKNIVALFEFQNRSWFSILFCINT